MTIRRLLILPMLLSLLLLSATTGAVPARGQGSGTTEPLPAIGGEWTGTWSAYNPAQGTTPAKELCKKLDCKIEYKEGTWVATFEGDCGRPYKYKISMEGRQVGKVVMFKGTTDLGEKDGGVYDWIGRATEKEFVGFFTSKFYTGTFNLAKAK